MSDSTPPDNVRSWWEMPQDYRVPVSRLDARIWLADGKERDVTLFFPPGVGVGSLLEEARSFFPASEQGRFLAISRDSVAAVWLREPEVAAPVDEELPTVSRSVSVTLVGRPPIRGTIRFVPSGVQDRTVDFLNEPARSFQVRAGDRLVHVAKAHVVAVLED